jgi:hypothetical protein
MADDTLDDYKPLIIFLYDQGDPEEEIVASLRINHGLETRYVSNSLQTRIIILTWS